MGDKSKIEWTDATWNPVRGCALVSHGCTNCYAMRQAHRTHGPGGAYQGLTKMTSHGPVWTGAVRLVPELLDQPLRWRRPRRIFVNSMSDLFHEDVPDAFIANIFSVMGFAQSHTFQLLTKRPSRMLDVLRSLDGSDLNLNFLNGDGRRWRGPWPLPNLWLGVSVEGQATADERIPLLLRTPAAVRFLSCEPLLGPINLPGIGRPQSARETPGPRLDWVIAGGESGPRARPSHPDWFRSLRDQCQAAGVPFFFKQYGEWAPYTYINKENGRPMLRITYTKREQERERIVGEGEAAINMRRLGKKAAGNVLDGRTWEEYPR